MSSETGRAGGDPARNLQVLLGGAGLLFFGWWWGSFSGPFRLFVDLQLRFLDTYSEPAAGIASALVVIAAVWVAVVMVSRAQPHLSHRAAEAIVAVLFTAASAAALWQVWDLWHAAEHMPRLGDPVQVVDLEAIGNAPLPLGHVRLIGTPDRSRQVLGHVTGRRARNSHWEAWVPLVSHRQHEPNAAWRIVATGRAPERLAASQAVPDDPQGMLLADSVDTRTVYEARQQGLDMPEHVLALYPDEGVRFDKFLNAALLGSFVVLFWGLAAHGRIKEHRGGTTPRVDGPAPPPPIEVTPDTTTGNASALPAPEPVDNAGAILTRAGSGGAVIALVGGGLLWEAFGFFPPHLALLGYAAAAMSLALSLLLIWLGQRFEAPTANVVASPPSVRVPPDALTPPPGAALLCVMRDEPGFSSPSYKRVDVDGVRVADLQANRYTVVALWPGPHTLAVNTRVSLTRDTVARFDLASGDVVAYRLQVAFFGAMRLERIADVHEARAVLARLTPVEHRRAA